MRAVAINCRDGVRLSIDHFKDGDHQTVVIICPGFFQSKDTPTFQRLARLLAEDRDVLAMDFRGHGRSQGLYTFSAKEGQDLEAVLEWAAARYQHIGVLGFSLGGAIMITTVSRLKAPVRSLVAVSAPAAFEEIEFKWWTPEAIQTGLQGLERGAGCRPASLWMKKERPIDCVRQLAPLPILFIHGTRDATVGVEHSRRLYAAASEPKRLEIIEGGSHAEALFRDEPEKFHRHLKDWFDRTLPTSAVPA